MTARFRDITNLDEAQAYYEGLAERWPERAAVIEHLCEHFVLVSPTGTVVELCAGGGQLAYALLSRFQQLRYVGFDLSEHGVAYARQKLARFGPRVTLVQADLNGDAWLDHAPGAVDAWLSLQSLHDLGDASAVARIYGVGRGLLQPGGYAIFADLLRASAADPAADPGRLTVDTHVELLTAAGYANVRCTMETHNFGCFVAEAA